MSRSGPNRTHFPGAHGGVRAAAGLILLRRPWLPCEGRRVRRVSQQEDQPVRIAAEQLTMVPIDDLIPYANNAKKHGVKQINQIRASLR